MKWEGDLRETVLEFVNVKVAARDEPALAWLLQRVVFALLEIDIEPDQIRHHVNYVLA